MRSKSITFIPPQTALSRQEPPAGDGLSSGPASLRTPPFSIRPAARPKIIPIVQVGITLDRTASTMEFADGVTKCLPLILDPLEGKAREVQVWLQTHGDRECGQDEVLLTDAGTTAQAIADAKTIVYEGGGDPAEHHLDAIDTLHGRIPWNPDPAESRRALVAVITADSKPAQSRRSAAEIGKSIHASGVALYVIGQPTPTLVELVEAASGFFFEISNNPQPTEMQRIADAVGASITSPLSKPATRTAPASNV